jgi:hypothetical protein
MKRSDRDELLREVFVDEHVERLRHASLEAALAMLRARRRRRAWISGAAATLVLAAVAAVSIRRPRPVAAVPVPSQAAASPVRIIGDEDLLALFPNRSLALIGRPGEQRLVFFTDNETHPVKR